MTQRQYRTRPFTIRDMKQQEIPLERILPETGGIFNLDWDLMVKLSNAAIVRGDPITEDTSVKEALTVFSEVVKSGFLAVD